MKTRQQSSHSFIVTSHRSLFKRVIEFIFTTSLWFYGLSVSLFFIANLLNINLLNIRLLNAAFKTTSDEVDSFLYLSLFIFVTILIALLIWKFYNSHRFGRLRRRTYPEDTTYNDLLMLNLVDDATLTLLQTSNLISFETNPIEHPNEMIKKEVNNEDIF